MLPIVLRYYFGPFWGTTAGLSMVCCSLFWRLYRALGSIVLDYPRLAVLAWPACLPPAAICAPDRKHIPSFKPDQPPRLIAAIWVARAGVPSVICCPVLFSTVPIFWKPA